MDLQFRIFLFQNQVSFDYTGIHSAFLQCLQNLLENKHLPLKNISSTIKVSIRLEKCEFSFMQHINETVDGALPLRNP